MEFNFSIVQPNLYDDQVSLGDSMRYGAYLKGKKKIPEINVNVPLVFCP